MKRLLLTAMSAATFSFAFDAAAYCPCYTLSSASNDHECGIEAVPGTNPTPAQWQDIFDLVAQGPSVWGTAGPDVGDIGQGCGKPEPLHDVPARFPCELLKAIAMAESGWKQFCVPETPADQAGPPERTIISFDCGYGVGQVTSGMHSGETPSFDRQRVASDATYNLATGTQILASKWRATNCVGDNQPGVVEHWYTAAWAYNGLAWSNNPNNPNHDPNRGVYDPSVGGSYAYQEKVFGRIEHPTSGYWNSVALAYPDRADCGDGGSPPELPEPSCASPTDCNNTRGTHQSECFTTDPPDGGTGGSAGAAGAGAGGGSGGSTGMGGAAGAGGAGGSSTGGVAGSVGQPDASSAGNGGLQYYQSDEADGCACRTGRGSTSSHVFWVALAGWVVVAGARRRPPKIS